MQLREGTNKPYPPRLYISEKECLDNKVGSLINLDNLLKTRKYKQYESFDHRFMCKFISQKIPLNYLSSDNVLSERYLRMFSRALWNEFDRNPQSNKCRIITTRDYIGSKNKDDLIDSVKYVLPKSRLLIYIGDSIIELTQENTINVTNYKDYINHIFGNEEELINILKEIKDCLYKNIKQTLLPISVMNRG